MLHVCVKKSFLDSILFFLKKKYMRFLRLCKKLFHISHFKEIYISNYTFSLLFKIFFSITLIFSIIYGGHSLRIIKILEDILDLSIQKITIEGNRRVSDIDVIDFLQLDGRSSIISFDIRKAQLNLENSPWISSASIRRVYPNQLKIIIVEHIPMALWQHHGKIDIIDQSGNIIAPYSSIYDSFPLFIGDGAAHNAQDFLKNIKDFKFIKDHILAFIRINDRRWNVFLDNGIFIKLPEVNAYKRLQEFMRFVEKNNIFKKNIKSIDLRFNDRIIFKFSDINFFYSEMKKHSTVQRKQGKNI